MNAIPDEQAALLRAIVAHAAEDTPRLVYADWLEEHGDAEQAGFIRDSVKLADMKPRAKGRKALAARLQELAREHCYKWYEPLGIADPDSIDRFDRGFPYRVTFDSAETFFVAADTLFAFVPIRGLAIDGGDFDNDSLQRFAAIPELSRITDLRLFYHSQIAPEAWRVLFRSPHLNGLTHLTLGNCGIYDAETQELASAPVLANLISLDLGYNAIGVEGAQSLLDSPHLTKLKHLWLEHNFFGEEEDEDALMEALEERFGDGFHWDGSPEDEEEDIV